MLQSIGPTELIVVLVIVLLLFGAGRVSSLGKELGTAIGEFKKGLKEDETEDSEVSPETGSIG